MLRELVFVYRCADRCDCTNHGITSKYAALYLYDGERAECIEDAKKRGCADEALWLNRRLLWGEKHYFAEPLIEPDVNGPHMFGGNFVYTSDALFSRMCGTSTSAPLPVHDRYETWAQYEALSR